MKKQEIPPISDASQKWFLDLCMERFGSMTKKDYEVALFHVLLDNGFREMSDFDISQRMQITETKIRNLRYESELVHPSDKNYKQRLIDILKRSTYKTDGRKIQFSIKDKLLRLYANSLLEKDGNFSDSSFNTSIVSVAPMDLVQLVVKLSDKEENSDYQKVMDRVRETTSLSMKELPQPLSEKVKNGAIAFVKEVANAVAPRFGEFLADTILKQL